MSHMTSKIWTRSVLACLIGAGAVGLGCAQEREPINRVQANALAKAFFVGPDLQSHHDDPEFFSQATLVDVGYGAMYSSLVTQTWAQSPMRLKWVIEEDLLLGRITYERIDDTDGKGAGRATDDGVIAVAFPILGHFDIKRAYNPSTGEELNVIEENTTDRPWYQREYFRVDWSKNLNVDAYDFDMLSLIGVIDGVTYEPLSYYVNDPNHEDAPHFDVQSGYFDVTTKAFAQPQTIDLSKWGWGLEAIPACWLDNDFMSGTLPSGTCNPIEITVRWSFRQVVDNDFEPQHWDGHRFAAYGAFYKERYGFDLNFGMSDDKWRRFVARHNIWERSHAYLYPDTMQVPAPCYTPASTLPGQSPHRDVNKDGTEDECQTFFTDGTIKYGRFVDRDGDGPGTEEVWVETGPGSRCDEFRQRCTLPYQKRVPKPMAWYYTNKGDPRFFDPSDWAVHEWDVALRGAVMAAKYGECKRVGPSLCKASADCKKYSGCASGCTDELEMQCQKKCTGETKDACLKACQEDYGKCREACDEDQPAGATAYANIVECRGYPMFDGQMDDNYDAIWLAREVDDCRRGLTRAGQDCEKVAAELGKARAMHPAVIELAKMPEMIVLCHSPVVAEDPDICGPVGRTVRMADLRYHQVNSIPKPQSPSYWGIYTDVEDPLSGEKIAGSMNVWTTVNDRFAEEVVERIRYIKGELKTADITDGSYVRDWVRANDIAASGSIMAGMTRAEVDRRIAEFAGNLANQDRAIPGPQNGQQAANMERLRQELQATVADARAPSANAPIYEQRRRSALGTKVEAALVTPAMQQYAGVDQLPLNDLVMQYASPLRLAHPGVQRQLRQLREVALAERGACIIEPEAPAPLAIHGLADVLEQKFGKLNPKDPLEKQIARAKQMVEWVARHAHYGVVIHEMGHGMALRHNFLSSADSFGYRPQYWQLRTKNGTVTKPCTELGDGESCVGPRYLDPVTENERQNLIWMFMQSSTMDYAGDHLQELIGIGVWDFAAMRMIYGEMAPVFADESYKRTKPRGIGAIDKIDNFGGIVGLQYQMGTKVIHYSQLQTEWELLRPGTCREIKPENYKPAAWDEKKEGPWNALLDGLLVTVDGKYKMCRQQKVDYVPWNSLVVKDKNEWVKAVPLYDQHDRTRVPYPFATDSWADVGNLSVYRHDNGADPYELFNYWIARQEVDHIFDNYRRNRMSFSVRATADRTLARYGEKMRDGAKGIGLFRNIIRDEAIEIGVDSDQEWAKYARVDWLRDVILGAGIGFDHFTRQVARPQPGPHMFISGDEVLRSNDDTYLQGPVKVIIPNGATGYYADVGIGGRLLENRLADDRGEYDRDYTLNCGSYYDKAFAAYLMAESADNYISATRKDFLDPRFRAVSLADLFPDGYRRWLGNNLTGDDFIKGPRLAADEAGNPLLEPESSLGPEGAPCSGSACRYPAMPIGWTSWWPPSGPETCFPAQGRIVCGRYGEDTGALQNPDAPKNVAVIEPQVGWDQQKFLIAWTMMYLPENQQQWWLDMMRIWEIGLDADPGFSNRIELHIPTGKIYVARTFGKEDIFGRSVQKGIAARVLEYANALLFQAYHTTPGPDLDGDGQPDWYSPALSEPGGQPMVRWDPGVKSTSTCNSEDESGCTCASNRYCQWLDRYVEVPFFMRQSLAAYGLTDLSQKGIWD
ncbi:MAG: hypothetical protein HY744_26710 [Deltaproteobacteria bacterium]|nr:hypothetical protein [Deltaproteobacteria bacterium]